jgi:hypothetical protein
MIRNMLGVIWAQAAMNRFMKKLGDALQWGRSG